jgi:Ca-activated chloride channel family protein
LELPLTHTEVQIEISGFVARATVTQHYHNPFAKPIEAVYTFPLPDDGAVDEMRMTIGERTIVGLVKRREEARQIYEQARDRGQRASLLEQERPNIFTQSVANILPGDEIQITLRYVHLLRYAEGAYELVFPMVVGPRYIPGEAASERSGTGIASDTDVVKDAARITPPVLQPGQRSGHDIALAVTLDAGVPVRGLHSISHAIDVEELSDQQRRLRLHPSDTLPNKDFVLRYQVAGPAPQMALLAHHDERGGFFTLLVQPQRTVADDEVVPRELIFLLDTSGSMQGFPMEKSKEAMRRLIQGMRSADTFNVVRFAGDTGTLWPRPKPYTQENAAEALRFVEALQGRGGTEMRRGILEALAQPAEEGKLRIAFLLTDGYVGDEFRILQAIEQERRGARVFCLGVGSSVNRYLLDRAATVGRGEAFYLRQDEESEAVIERFFQRVDRPALAHIEIDWAGLDVQEIYPARVPDLWSGQPIRVHGRYSRGGDKTITVRGQLGKRPYSQKLPVALPANQPAHAAIATLWAREKIRALMLKMVQEQDQQEALVEQVTKLGLEFRLMTQWTSFVAVEEKVVYQEGKPQTVVQPVELPEGVAYEGIFGTPGESHERQREQMPSAAGPGVAAGAGVVGLMRSLSDLVGGSRPESPPPASGVGSIRGLQERSSATTADESLAWSPPASLPPTKLQAEERFRGEAEKLQADLAAPEPTMASPAEPRPCRFEAIAVSGGLRYPQVVQVLNARRQEICEVYTQRRQQQPSLAGRLEITLTVAAEGKVAAVELKALTLHDQPLEETLKKAFAGWQFPPLAGGGQAKVTFTLGLG